jgi:hypothetical protein
VVWLLPQAWAIACGVSDAPLTTGKEPTLVVDSGETPRAVSLALKGM